MSLLSNYLVTALSFSLRLQARPLLFSYRNQISYQERIESKFGHQLWMDKPFSLDAVGNVTNFDVSARNRPSGTLRPLHTILGIRSILEVHVVKLSPRFVISNRISPNQPLYIQTNEKKYFKSKGSMNFHCKSCNNIRVFILVWKDLDSLISQLEMSGNVHEND